MYETEQNTNFFVQEKVPDAAVTKASVD